MPAWRRATDTAAFTRIHHESGFAGGHLRLSVERFRYPDGLEVPREIVEFGEVVAVLAYDEEHVFLVAQPREAVGEPALMEVCAGGVDGDELPQAAAERELAEELGLGARDWEALGCFYPSPGVLEERIHLFLATGLYEHALAPDDSERITIVRWPLAELAELQARCRDLKTLVCVQALSARQALIGV